MNTSNAQGSMGVQTASVSLCSQQKLLFLCQGKERKKKKKKKPLHHFSNGSGPHYVQKNSPGCVRGKISENCAARKVKMQAGPGWEVCRALILLHRGTDFNKAGSLRGDAGLTHTCCRGSLSCFVLCSEFSSFRLSNQKAATL